MNYWTYIYGRTYEKDFRTLCTPPTSIVDENNRAKIECFVKEVLNTDKPSNGRIDPATYRYTYMYFDTFILWGIAFSHDSERFNQFGLSDYVHDKKRQHHGVRSFIGVVLEKETFQAMDSIPLSDKLFFELFRKYVVPYWNWQEFKPWKPIFSDKETLILSESSQTIQLTNLVNLNNDTNYCAFYCQENFNNIVASLKLCKTNFVSGLNVESHIIDAANNNTPVFINNAICHNTKNIHKEQLRKKNQNILEEKTISFNSSGETKILKVQAINVENNTDWVITSITDKGVTIEALKNTTTTTRTCQLYVNATNKDYLLTIAQPPQRNRFKELFDGIFIPSAKQKKQSANKVEQEETSLSSSPRLPIIPNQIKSADIVNNSTSTQGQAQMAEQLLDWGGNWNDNETNTTANHISEANEGVQPVAEPITNNEDTKIDEESLSPFNAFKSNEDDLTKEDKLQTLLQSLIDKIGVDDAIEQLSNLLNTL